MKSLPFVEEHKWSVSGYVNESKDDAEDSQKMLEIRYLNGVEKEMAMGIRGLLHRFHIREEENDRPERVYGFNQEQDMMELDQFISRLLI